MFDLRKTKKIDLTKSKYFKEGVTYQFTDELTGKKLVAKLIGHYNDDEGEYLIREFKKLIMLSGEPEIGTVLFLATAILTGEEKGCYVMEYIEGETLASFLKTNKTISHDIVVDIISQIASGLEKAHHHEIFHSDLHNENIIIDRIGYVKLIDFAWYDYKMQAAFNFEKDVEDFKKIVNELFEKCIDNKDSLVKKVCLEAVNFKGLKKKIILANDIAFDWEKLPEDSKMIISDILNIWNGNRMYNSVFGEIRQPLDNKLIPELDLNEKKHNSKSSGLYGMLDSHRNLKIENQIESKFLTRLNPLRQAGLITDWKIQVNNGGETFDGPYYVSYTISLSGKFYKWKKNSLDFNFLKPTGLKIGVFKLITAS